MSEKRRHRTTETPLHRAEQRAARREGYLDAALAVIRDEGPSASMEAIANAAGVSKPILYRHFRDRDGLVAALADRFADELVEQLEAVLSKPGSADQLLRASIEAYVATIEKDPSLYRYLTQRTPARGAALSTLVDRVAAVIARVLADGLRTMGRDSGSARPWSYGIVGMIHLAGDDWVAHPGISREHLVDELSQLLWHGLTGAFPGAASDAAAQALPR